MIVQIARNPDFHVDATVLAEEARVVLRFCGVINESSDFQTIQDFVFRQPLEVKECLLDLERVERINSAGVSGWKNFLARIQARVPTAIERVSEPFVELAASISAVLGRRGTPVHSVMIPYLCTPCSLREFSPFVLSEELRQGSFAPEPRLCSACGSPMIFDSLETVYVLAIEALLERRKRRRGPN